MKFKVNREALIKPLQQVTGVVEKRQTLPVLSNVLFQVESNLLSLIGTDLEVEMISRVVLDNAEPGEVTVPARKLVDICRELPENAEIEFGLKDQKLTIRSGRFRSTLATLPATDFPSIDKTLADLNFRVDVDVIKRLISRTIFAMAQQDVRYFLNGMLFEIGGGHIRTVATDGHRLAMCRFSLEEESELRQVIVPRKGVQEIQRLLNELSGEVNISISLNHICAESEEFVLTSKLVDGRFPDYDRVIPKNGDKLVLIDRLEFKQALNRIAILSNEKFRGIRANFSSGQLTLSANNPEQEEAEETIVVDYEGQNIEIGFNVVYLQDVLSVIEGDKVRIVLHDGNSSVLLEEPEEDNSVYVVMPMKL